MTKRLYLKSAYSSGFDLRTVTDCILKSVDFSQDCLERPDIWLVLGGSVLNNPENFLMQLLKEAFMD
ncbi:MAG: hypothetical protein MI750_15390, partial [Xanthomonadales bacterium]|nr:hypothetical protein [Xanthomonadales bacterium]